MRLLEGGRAAAGFRRRSDFRREIEDGFRPMLRLPQGMFLVTGPTGSGKSTTLYSSLH